MQSKLLDRQLKEGRNTFSLGFQREKALCPTTLGLREKPSSATLQDFSQYPLPVLLLLLVGVVFFKSLNTGSLSQLKCWWTSFVWRIGTATVTGSLSTQVVGKPKQILFKGTVLCWLGFSQGIWPRGGSAGEAPPHTISVCNGPGARSLQPGLRLLGLGHFLACSSEVAFNLHKLGSVFLLFLQFLLLKFKLLQLLLPL